MNKLITNLPKYTATNNNANKVLSVPFTIQILNNCLKYNIDYNLIKSLHLFDLECLIVQQQIKEVKTQLENIQQQERKKRGITSVKKISGSEALEYLKGGTI